MKNLLNSKDTINLVVLNILTILLMIFNSSYSELISLNSFLLPIPFAITYALFDKRITFISLIINVIFTALITKNLILTIISGFTVLILGIIIGKSVKEKKGIGVSIFMILIATIILSLITMILYITVIEKISLYDALNSVNIFINDYLKNVSSREEFSGIIISTEDILVNIPIMFALYYAINSILNHFITLKVVCAIKGEKTYLRPFEQCYISNILGAVLIVIYCLGIILDRSGFQVGNYISNLFYFILTTLLTVNGLAATYNFFINKFKYTKTISIIILLASFFVMPDVLILIGFIEMIIDFRKLDPHRIFNRK